MSPEGVAGELLLPFRSLSSALALLSFAALGLLINAAGVFGIWLSIIVVPALFRYLALVAESRAQGRDVAPPGIEYFTLGGNLWTLFPLVPVAGFGLLIAAGLARDPALGWLAGVAAALVFPAMIAVLVITHSGLQSLNPLALGRLARAVGPSYLVVPALVILVAWAASSLPGLPDWALGSAALYAAFVFCALTGALIREQGLLEAIEIPDAPEVRAAAHGAEVGKERRAALSHAYALASRGNVDGALRHLGESIDHDPEPALARTWLFTQMLTWEDTRPALYLAQHNLAYLLAQGEDVRAVKLMLRCKLVNDEFRPLPEDIPAAAAAARRCGNETLAASLAGGPASA